MKKRSASTSCAMRALSLSPRWRALAIVALIRAIDSIKAFDLFYIMTRAGRRCRPRR
ncbi:hypothetical protein MES5069_930008 [Mesorhizobium escarrei]|uniref:Uncharacterized protein n=1 Tax=Mesorhizobium escarrei TaxID=666018 RepID=A0ABM9EJS8_9HYPH|nr:hypothetical protein MES5069_930008 [Mesorhizobium escarrei]